MDPAVDQRIAEAMARTVPGSMAPRSEGEVIGQDLDQGKRRTEDLRQLFEDDKGEAKGEYRVRSPTNSERMNRALKELRPAAFKIHELLWKWRGAPARGTLPFFTIRSLEKFCNLTRPTVRVAMLELTRKGWIIRETYNKHHKNALYRLAPIRKVPAPN